MADTQVAPGAAIATHPSPARAAAPPALPPAACPGTSQRIGSGRRRAPAKTARSAPSAAAPAWRPHPGTPGAWQKRWVHTLQPRWYAATQRSGPPETAACRDMCKGTGAGWAQARYTLQRPRAANGRFGCLAAAASSSSSSTSRRCNVRAERRLDSLPAPVDVQRGDHGGVAICRRVAALPGACPLELGQGRRTFGRRPAALEGLAIRCAVGCRGWQLHCGPSHLAAGCQGPGGRRRHAAPSKRRRQQHAPLHIRQAVAAGGQQQQGDARRAHQSQPPCPRPPRPGALLREGPYRHREGLSQPPLQLRRPRSQRLKQVHWDVTSAPCTAAVCGATAERLTQNREPAILKESAWLLPLRDLEPVRCMAIDHSSPGGWDQPCSEACPAKRLVTSGANCACPLVSCTILLGKQECQSTGRSHSLAAAAPPAARAGRVRRQRRPHCPQRRLFSWGLGISNSAWMHIEARHGHY